MRAKDLHSEPATERKAGKSLPHGRPMRRNHCFHDLGFGGLAPQPCPSDAQIFRFAERQHLRNRRRSDQTIALPEDLFGQIVTDDLAAAFHPENAKPRKLEGPQILDRFTVEGLVVQYDDLGQKFRVGSNGGVWTIGQQPSPEDEHEYQPRNGSDDPHGSDLEYRECFHTHFARHAVHEKIGRCADERAGAAEDGCIGYRNEEAR